ncbi:alkaline serine exoprotease A-like [Anneissia japonica]|uniref:alkaline serine exoprotease A-like n=1 Tax=Anneissia japonica TaxID=1529436 RepID=UPI001425B3B7|nr:alkaline serine exoprotease A-like [Anneissia japonica]
MKLFEVLSGTVFVLLLARLNQACPRTPECTSIHDREELRAGKAALYNGKSEGNRYIVVLEDDEDTDAMKKKVDNVRSSESSRITPCKTLNGHSNGINAVVCDLNEDELDQILEMEGVKYVEKSLVGKLSAYTDVWGLDRIDQRNLPLDNNYSPIGNGYNEIVYVIDSGVNTDHAMFGGRAENWHEVVKTDEEDCIGHGTHVAGTIAAATYGVAQGVKIRSVRVGGCSANVDEEDVVEAINYILNNGDSGSIVSMSLGFDKCKAIDDAVKRLIRADYVVVASAGNDEKDACDQSPARVTEAITVGATDDTDTRASFSNFGTGVDVFAPGVAVESLDNESNDGTKIKSGTSMSAPHVSGVAAILRCDGVRAGEVRQKIIDQSTKNKVKDPKGSNNCLLFTY